MRRGLTDERFFKGLGSVVLGGLVGSCLGAATFLTVEALIPNPSTADPGICQLLSGANGCSPETEHPPAAAGDLP